MLDEKLKNAAQPQLVTVAYDGTSGISLSIRTIWMVIKAHNINQVNRNMHGVFIDVSSF